MDVNNFLRVSCVFGVFVLLGGCIYFVLPILELIDGYVIRTKVATHDMFMKSILLD
jgi:hypothetical protein